MVNSAGRLAILLPPVFNLCQNRAHHLLNISLNADGERLIRVWRFESLKLALQHPGFHVMTLPGLHSRPDEVKVTVQMDKPDAGVAIAKLIPVTLLESGTGENACFSTRQMVVNQIAQAGQPGRPILVVEWNATCHPGNVLRRVEIIAVEEGAAQPLCQCLPNGGFPATSHPHHDEECH